ncbi:hypothetical protein GCM10022237_47190 [Nocardioides ginsengisoli]|uniref:FxsA family protein n=1 Tax=Nocardioides ginsengisoli TaxID=363868 RepID=A0ABW3W1S9_9ACTN
MTKRGRRTLALVLLAFGLAVVAEIAVLVEVARLIGPGWTFVLVLLGVVLGAAVAKHAGRRAWLALREGLETGRPPSREVGDGALVMLGGVLLAVPGFLTDLVALLLIVPLTRPLFRGLFGAVASRQVARRTAGFPPGFPGRQTPENDTRPGPTVVQGEVIDESD